MRRQERSQPSHTTRTVPDRARTSAEVRATAVTPGTSHPDRAPPAQTPVRIPRSSGALPSWPCTPSRVPRAVTVRRPRSELVARSNDQPAPVVFGRPRPAGPCLQGRCRHRAQSAPDRQASSAHPRSPTGHRCMHTCTARRPAHRSSAGPHSQGGDTGSNPVGGATLCRCSSAGVRCAFEQGPRGDPSGDRVQHAPNRLPVPAHRGLFLPASSAATLADTASAIARSRFR